MAKIIGSRILFQKPSSKAVEFPAGIQAEFTADLLERFKQAAMPIEAELDDNLENPSFLASFLQECVEEDLMSSLSCSEFGKGYLFGLIVGVYACQQYMDEDEDEVYEEEAE